VTFEHLTDAEDPRTNDDNVRDGECDDSLESITFKVEDGVVTNPGDNHELDGAVYSTTDHVRHDGIFGYLSNLWN